MDEFAKMIYEQWEKTQEGENFELGEGYNETWQKLYDILNDKVATEIECSVNKKVWEVQEKALWQDLDMPASAFQMAKLS